MILFNTVKMSRSVNVFKFNVLIADRINMKLTETEVEVIARNEREGELEIGKRLDNIVKCEAVSSRKETIVIDRRTIESVLTSVEVCDNE